MPIHIPRPNLGDVLVRERELTRMPKAQPQIEEATVISRVYPKGSDPDGYMWQVSLHSLLEGGIVPFDGGSVKSQPRTAGDWRPADWIFYDNGLPVFDTKGKLMKKSGNIQFDGVPCWGPPYWCDGKPYRGPVDDETVKEKQIIVARFTEPPPTPAPSRTQLSVGA